MKVCECIYCLLENGSFILFNMTSSVLFLLHSQFMDLIALVEKRPAVSELLAAFNEQTVSDYVVVYLRLLTSGHLQRDGVFYQHFIEGGRSVKEFCQQVKKICAFVFYSSQSLENCLSDGLLNFLSVLRKVMEIF